MRERGIDISQNKPKLLTQEMVDRADQIITMGCSFENGCPAVFISQNRPADDWGLDDPRGKPLEEVREIRDEIEERGEKAGGWGIALGAGLVRLLTLLLSLSLPVAHAVHPGAVGPAYKALP